MNWKRAALAAGAGAAGVTVICAGLYSFLFIALYNTGIVAFNDNRPSAVQWLLMLTIPPAMVSVGGALPAHALGTGWRRSLVIALVAHVVAISVLVMMLRWEPFDDLRSYVATPFATAAALTVLLATRYSSITIDPRASAAVIIAGAVMILLSLLFPYVTVGIAVGILAWILLPAITMLPRSPNRALS